MEKVFVMGMGYVGFPLACAIAKSQKYEVYGFDIDARKIGLVNSKKSPVEDETAEKDIEEVEIIGTTDPISMSKAKYIIVCVPTPVLANKMPDLKPIIFATEIIAKYLQKGQFVVIESTISPGVCEEVVAPILEKTGLEMGKDFELCHCPERINPGDSKWNVYNIARNIGASTIKGTKEIANFYRDFIQAEINEMPDLKHTEATKIIENTFRDINIAFVNELAKSFDKLGLDIKEVIKGAANKPFAFMPHYPSCGVGGHCIPVDPYYLIERAKKAGFDHKFLSIAREINNSMPEYVVDQLIKSLNKVSKSIKGTKIGLLGLSYKKDISDLRESPALEIKKILLSYEADLEIFDPFNLEYSTVTSLEEVIKKSEAIIVASDHSLFIEKINKEFILKSDIKVIIDGKNCLDKNDFVNSNIIYKGIWR